MLVAVPSKGRAAGMPTIDYMGSLATLFVPESELSQYRSSYPHVEAIGVPDDVRGITRTRNWILDNTEHDWVVMIDDDLASQGYMELMPFKGKCRKLKPKEWIDEWRKLFEVTEDIGYRIWGTSTDGALRSVYPWSPFLWHSYITGSCMGLRNSTGIRFDESYPVKEDYEICLRCIKEDGGVVAARYLFWRNKHWTDEGGCKTYRTSVMEKQMVDKLVADYKGLIRSVKRAGGASDYSIQLDF